MQQEVLVYKDITWLLSRVWLFHLVHHTTCTFSPCYITLVSSYLSHNSLLIGRSYACVEMLCSQLVFYSRAIT